MSLELVDSGNIYCAARSGFSGRGFYNNRVSIGDYEIEIGDFCALAFYVFTNTDLAENDPRKAVVAKIKNLVVVEGFNHGNKRYEEAQQPLHPDTIGAG